MASGGSRGPVRGQDDLARALRNARKLLTGKWGLYRALCTPSVEAGRLGSPERSGRVVREMDPPAVGRSD